ncbi:MAG: hypothetical protein GOV15_04020, partial [Candidatus Diapherotrites archaeon]|nr:hypothetical protein [Candidatus Diapherotrites archaeon]
AETVGKTFTELISTWPLMASGIGLVIVAVIFWFVLKKIMMNTILGLSLMGAIYFAFPEIFAKLSAHLIPTLVVTMIFGVGGIGAMLLFVWLGII